PDPARREPLPELRRRRRLRRLGPAGAHRAGDPARDDPASPPEGPVVIAVTDVTKRFGDFQALDGVSIDVDDGSLTALLGPSGSGKSAPLRGLAVPRGPDAGHVQ